MTVDLLGSPLNRAVLKAYATDPASGLVGAPLVALADIKSNWEVKIGGPIYQQMLPLSIFATGSPAWMVEMQALGDLYPGGAAPVPPPVLAITISAPADGAAIPDLSDIPIAAAVTGGTAPYSTQFQYNGVDEGVPQTGTAPAVTVLAAGTAPGTGIPITATVTDAGGTANVTITVDIVVIALAATVSVDGQEATLTWDATGDTSKSVLIDWGDGTGEANYPHDVGFAKHTYAGPGSYAGTYHQDPDAPTSFSATALLSGAIIDGEVGPEFTAYGMPFWIKKVSPCRVGFDLQDGDPDPDIWLLWVRVTLLDIEQRQKDAIKAQLDAIGC